jgi:ribosomal protein S8E
MSTVDEEETYEEEEETRPLNAEEVTLIATEFLRRLGHKHGLKPIKASLQEERYVVEVRLKKKTATVEIDATSEEIMQYEITVVTKESSPSFPLTRKNILLIGGIVVVSVFASSLLGIQSFIGSIF